MSASEVQVSTAAGVRGHALAAAPGTFLRRKDFAGSDRAVESALSRLALADDYVLNRS